jgi:cyclopropane fatty-acyl-phospholipid synthase-like methyltransferase
MTINQLDKDIDWAKQYDYYEVELRDGYRTISRTQNESHFEMLKGKAKSYLTKDKVFCEIGFSAGLTLRYALKYFGKVYGLDISPKNVEFTKEELIEEGYSGFELYTSDLLKFDKRFENKFDVISFIHGLEHFKDDDYKLILSNIKNYLRPDGIFTGALPYKNKFNYRMCPACDRVFEIDGHVSSHDIDSLSSIFNENGFKIVHIDNFNLRYALSHGSIMKRAYRFIVYFLFKRRSATQIEYIVKTG